MTHASAAPPRILIVDDDPEWRALFATALDQAGYETLEAVTGQEGLAMARRELPRVVILEVALPGLCGYEVCYQLRTEFGEGLPIIFVSGDRTQPFDAVAGLMLGADDYLTKPVSPDELLARVRRLDRRTLPIVPGVAAKLTKREMDVLRLLAEGHEQEEIAHELYISRKTVGTHIEHILRKLGVRSRAQAVALAYRDDLVGAPS
jgi:DNA-binding NarL/FixJ family response regulator